jgi:hypothetical protein
MVVLNSFEPKVKPHHQGESCAGFFQKTENVLQVHAYPFHQRAMRCALSFTHPHARCNIGEIMGTISLR